MIARWCISVFIFGLTLFGVVSQQQIALPNQEIILQFENVDLTSNQTENAVATIKEQLQGLGAKNIKVLPLGTGKLKITYFCKADIASIKQLFLGEEALALQLKPQDQEAPKDPFQELNINYNINVYEIETGQYSAWDFDDAIRLDIEVKSDRFLDPNSISTDSFGYNYVYNLIYITYKIRKVTRISISDSLHIIPEVRAGPLV